MKIGILTFHCAHNYGAVLQCYALQETLKQMGHKVEVIDYRPQYLLKPYAILNKERFISTNPFKILKRIIREFLLLVVRLKRYKVFEDFIQNKLILSCRVTKNNIPSYYDVYIMGSDQIWNPYITDGFDPVYFGLFNFQKGNKKYISYAASMETKILDDHAKNTYKRILNNFDSVSVRETQLASLLQPLTDLKINVVTDPTLLADITIWKKLARKPDLNKKYVLVYQVRTSNETLRIANGIAKQINAVVVEVTAWHKTNFKKNNLQCESPESFIGLIKYASCIITTSFHGTAFSIIFNKPFYCIKLDDGSDTRSISLLNSVALIDRMIDKKEKVPVFSKINYDIVNDKISKLRNESLDFLRSSLNI